MHLLPPPPTPPMTSYEGASTLKRTFKSILFVCVLYGFKKTIAAPTAILIDLTIFVVGDQWSLTYARSVCLMVRIQQHQAAAMAQLAARAAASSLSKIVKSWPQQTLSRSERYIVVTVPLPNKRSANDPCHSI